MVFHMHHINGYQKYEKSFSIFPCLTLSASNIGVQVRRARAVTSDAWFCKFFLYNYGARDEIMNRAFSLVKQQDDYLAPYPHLLHKTNGTEP